MSLVVLLMIFVASRSLASSAARLQAEMAVSQQIVAATEALTGDLLAATSGIDRFVLSGQEEHLAAYRHWRDTAPPVIADLRRSRSRDASVQVHLDRIDSGFADLERTWAELRQHAALPGLELASPPAQLLHQAAQTTDLIQKELRAVRLAEVSRSKSLASEQTSVGGQGQTLTLASVLLSALIFLLFYFLCRSQARMAPPDESIAVLHRELNQANENAFESILALADLQDQTRVLHSVLQSMTDGVVVTGQDGALLLSNPAAGVILSGRLQANPPLLETFQADGLTSVNQAELPLSRALRGETAAPAEYYFRCPGEPEGVYLSMTASPLADEKRARRGAVLVFSDISEHKRAQESLRVAKQEAERANSAKSEFLSRMSHELRTPLNAILGFAQLLEMSNLRDKDLDSVSQILKAGRHLLVLINEVLDISRIESGRLSLSPESIQLHELLEEVLVMIEPLVVRAGLHLEGFPDPCWTLYVTADRQRLKQVLLNLLSNAVKYNRPDGSIRLTTQSTEQRSRILVQDTGRGIGPDKIGRLFQPFERLGADETGVEGTGIGLALTKRLVEVMGGEIGVESQFGEGTTFWVELPRPAEAPPSPPCVQDLAAASPAGPSDELPTVLCIEDNPSNLRLVEHILSHRPLIRLLTARDGATGLRVAQEQRPGLILLDVHLGDMDGGDVLRELKANPDTAGIPVTIVSADATPHQRERLMNAGARTYLTKPLEVRALLDEVDQAFAAGVYS